MVLNKIFEYARTFPGKVAIYFHDQRITYGDFAFCISHAQQFLANQGLRSGSVAVMYVGSGVDAWVLGFALRSLGLTTIAVRSLESLDGLRLRNIGCVITMIREQPFEIASLPDNCKLIQIPYQMYLGKTADCIPIPSTGASAVGGHILLTSGTTGESKKVLIDDACVSKIIRRRAEVFGTSERSIVNIFNFMTWSSLGYNMPICTWSMGGSVVLHQGSDSHRSLFVDGITEAFVTPATLMTILKAPSCEVRKNNGMRLIVGGGPLPESLDSMARMRLTPNIFTYVASTEVGTWALTRIEHPEDLHSHAIHPSLSVQIVDEEHRPLPVGKLGAIRIQTVDGMTDYLDDEEASRASFRDGYFYSGDLGTFQADGRLVLHGRTTNVINILGYKVAAESREQALQKRLGVDGVCILSKVTEGEMEGLLIVIESQKSIAEAELMASVRAELPGFTHVHVSFVTTLPRNDMGKIDRAVLRQQIAETRGRAPI